MEHVRNLPNSIMITGLYDENDMFLEQLDKINLALLLLNDFVALYTTGTTGPQYYLYARKEF